MGASRALGFLEERGASTMRVLLFLSSLLCFALPLHAQDYVAPRGPDGVHPDLNGILASAGLSSL